MRAASHYYYFNTPTNQYHCTSHADLACILYVSTTKNEQLLSNHNPLPVDGKYKSSKPFKTMCMCIYKEWRYQENCMELTFNLSLKPAYICCFLKIFCPFLSCSALRSSMVSVYLHKYFLGESIRTHCLYIMDMHKRWSDLLLSCWNFCFNFVIRALNCSMDPSTPPRASTSLSAQIVEAFSKYSCERIYSQYWTLWVK